MMKTREPVWEYATRLFRETWFLASGGLGFLTSLFVAVFFPNLVMIPAVYGLMFLVGFVVANYQVFAHLFRECETAKTELTREVQRLKQEVRDLEAARPRINAGLQDSNRDLTKRVLLHLAPLPPEPDLDALVAERLRDLTDSRNAGHTPLNKLLDGLAPSLFAERNPSYEQDLERYAEEYRAFRVRCYEHSLVPERSFALAPIVRNLGQHPANHVIVELRMPRAYQIPEEHQSLETYQHFMEINQEVADDADDPWGLRVEWICKPPQPPEEYRQLFAELSLPSRVSHARYPSDPVHQVPSNTSGPNYLQKRGVIHVEYHIDQLVQHQPEDGFEPFEVWLGDIKESTVWQIPVTVTSSDLRQPLEDTLEVEIVITEDEGRPPEAGAGAERQAEER